MGLDYHSTTVLWRAAEVRISSVQTLLPMAYVLTLWLAHTSTIPFDLGSIPAAGPTLVTSTNDSVTFKQKLAFAATDGASNGFSYAGKPATRGPRHVAKIRSSTTD